MVEQLFFQFLGYYETLVLLLVHIAEVLWRRNSAVALGKKKTERKETVLFLESRGLFCQLQASLQVRWFFSDSKICMLVVQGREFASTCGIISLPLANTSYLACDRRSSLQSFHSTSWLKVLLISNSVYYMGVWLNWIVF